MVSGEESIGEEAAEKREQKRRAHEVGNGVSRSRRRQMHVFRKVQHQVACIRQIRQILHYLHNYHIFIIQFVFNKLINPSHHKKEMNK